MRITLLALDGVFDTGLATVRDAFGTANELAELTGIASLRFEVEVVGVRDRVHTAHGLRVPVAPAGGAAVPEVVVVPALGYKLPGPPADACSCSCTNSRPSAVTPLITDQGSRVSGACSTGVCPHGASVRATNGNGEPAGWGRRGRSSSPSPTATCPSASIA